MTRGLWRERQGYHKEDPEGDTGNEKRDEAGWLGEAEANGTLRRLESEAPSAPRIGCEKVRCKIGHSN